MNSAALFVRVIWTFIFSSVIKFITMNRFFIDIWENASRDVAETFILIGGTIYLILTLLLVMIGWKKIIRWKGWMAAFSFITGIGLSCITVYAPFLSSL